LKKLHINLAIIGTIAIIAILVFSIVFFSSQKGMLLQVNAPATTLPYTVVTNGNAWDGLITFGLSGPSSANYLVIMNTNGTLISLRSATSGYGVVKNIANDTLLFQGEPQVDGPANAPTYATHIWNLVTNTTVDYPNVIGHHEIEYDPNNNTFLTFQDYVMNVGNNSILFDKIVQFDSNGNVLWSWDTYNYIPLSEADPFNLTSPYNGQTVIDFTHANALSWDYNNSVVYLNLRHTNTFYKINQTTGNIIWACGQFGNFTLLDQNGNVVPNLWYHSHNLQQIAPDVFTMFNNDFDNITNYNDASSQMIEITLNEQTMTAQLNSSFTAPSQYYTTFLGAADILPNGDWIGDFGTPTHQFVENQPWNFNNTGAVLIEANQSGQILRTITFPTGWSIYRIGLATNITQNAFTAISTVTATPTVNPTPSQQTPIATTPPEITIPPVTQTSTTTPKPTINQVPTQTPAATPTIKVSPSALSSNSTQVIDITIIATAIVIVLVAFLASMRFLKQKNKKVTNT
jgi:hypothetical protein